MLFGNFVRLREEGGEKCLSSFLAYISTTTSARNVIQDCIEKEFHTLSIQTLRGCYKLLSRIKKASFRRVVNFRKLAENKRAVSKS